MHVKTTLSASNGHACSEDLLLLLFIFFYSRIITQANLFFLLLCFLNQNVNSLKHFSPDAHVPDTRRWQRAAKVQQALS